MPLLGNALRGADQEQGDAEDASPSTARGLKALSSKASADLRRVAFPGTSAPKDLAHLPLVPPAPPEADDFSTSSKRSNSKMLMELAAAPDSPSSGRSRMTDSKALELRRRTTSKGKVQVMAVPEVALPLQDDDIPGLPGVRESHVREAFTQIDFDGNGFIGVSELRYLLTVLGEEPKDDELDEMLAMIGSESDGQAAFEDFRMLFAPKSSVLAEMETMAPAPPEEEDKGGREEDDEQEEIPRLEAPPQQLGLLVKGAASFIQARIKKEEAGKKKASRARPKAKAPGSNRARPVRGPPRHTHQMGAPGMANLPIPGAGRGAFNSISQPPPVPGHTSGMPPLPPGYLVGTEKLYQTGPGMGPHGAAPGMLPNQMPPPPGQHPLPPGQPGAMAKQPPVDPLLQPSKKNITANPPPKHLTFLEYQEMKLEHEVHEKLRREAESDSD